MAVIVTDYEEGGDHLSRKKLGVADKPSDVLRPEFEDLIGPFVDRDKIVEIIIVRKP